MNQRRHTPGEKRDTHCTENRMDKVRDDFQSTYNHSSIRTVEEIYIGLFIFNALILSDIIIGNKN